MKTYLPRFHAKFLKTLGTLSLAALLVSCSGGGGDDGDGGDPGDGDAPGNAQDPGDDPDPGNDDDARPAVWDEMIFDQDLWQ